MADSVEISFVDENDIVKEVKWYFLSENSQWKISSTPLCGRLGQRPDCPSLSPYFLLLMLLLMLLCCVNQSCISISINISMSAVFLSAEKHESRVQSRSKNAKNGG